MSISIERGLKHMAWANQRVFESIEQLSKQALESYIVNPEWTAFRIAEHICKSSGFYGFRLGLGERPEESDKSLSIQELKILLGKRDQVLISAAQLEDRELEFNRSGTIMKRWVSTIVTQAVHHATEHRAQLIDALEFKGFKPINLDDIDLWSFDDFERSSKNTIG